METKQTTNHEEIKKWAETHNATPAVVEGSDGKDTSILRFKIQGENENLHEINWEHFFELFEENKLALVHDPNSNFNKFVSREE